jgi:DNA-binding GntR family transcriptional regulator
MLERRPLRRDVITLVIERLASGALPPGRITEAELAADLGVSRTPLREAMVELEQRGFLVSAMGRGFQVPPLTGVEARELYTLLARLEPLAFELGGATLRRQVPALRAILRRMAATTDTNALAGLAQAWTAKVVAACPSPRLAAMLSDLYLLTGRYERAALANGYPVGSAIETHAAILDRVAAGDVAGAGELVASAASSCLESLLAWLEPGTTVAAGALVAKVGPSRKAPRPRS